MGNKKLKAKIKKLKGQVRTLEQGQVMLDKGLASAEKTIKDLMRFIRASPEAQKEMLEIWAATDKAMSQILSNMEKCLLAGDPEVKPPESFQGLFRDLTSVPSPKAFVPPDMGPEVVAVARLSEPEDPALRPLTIRFPGHPCDGQTFQVPADLKDFAEKVQGKDESFRPAVPEDFPAYAKKAQGMDQGRRLGDPILKRSDIKGCRP